MRAPGALAALAVALAVGPARAQFAADSAAGLTLTEAVDRALATHPAVGAARAGLDAARATRGEERAAWFPAISLDASTTRFDEPMPVFPIHGFDMATLPPFDRTLLEAAISGRFTLFDGGRRGSRVARSGALVDAARAGLDAARMDLIERTVDAFLDVLTRREVVAAHDARLAALDAERERAARFVDVERAARIELLRAEAARAAARADRASAEAALSVAEGDLARLTGLPERPRLAARLVAPAVEVAPAPELADAGGEGVPPDVVRARAEARAADAARREARAAWLPDLQLSGAYVERDAPDVDAEGEWQAAVSLSYPLFTGGARSGAVDRARAESERARLAADATELESRGAVDRARAAVREAVARVAALDAAERQYEEVARIEKLSLDVGAGVQPDYLDAEADLLSARTSAIEARHAVLEARVALARARGALTPEWLARIVESKR